MAETYCRTLIVGQYLPSNKLAFLASQRPQETKIGTTRNGFKNWLVKLPQNIQQ
jgi:hypothetical protein